MTSENEQAVELPKSFARSILPWLVLAGALALYLATLNPWVTISNLGLAARLAGWSWEPALTEPLTLAVTYPLRWLPTPMQPAALNLLCAVCAAVTLALLARSVALLPHDRTKDQRLREGGDFALLSIRGAWAPPVLAVLACGLQFNFWEHAITGTGEMISLVLLAYIVRCLLEYRITERDSWLVRMAFAYGLATTNNFAMIGFFPIALTAVVWLKKLDFFNGRFFLKMAASGLAGLSLYLLLPLLATRYHHESLTFWAVLKYQLSQQKQFLFFAPAKLPALLLGTCTVLPLLVVAIRWPSSMGDVNPLSNLLSNLMFKVVHLGFFAAALGMFFGPAIFEIQFRNAFPIPFLSLYYLGALCIGYFAGYLLLVFGVPATKAWAKPNVLEVVFNKLVVVVTYTCLLAVPGIFAYKNLPKIQAVNSPVLRQYAARLVQSLPAEGAVMLSDQPLQLLLVEAYYARQKAAMPHVPINTFALKGQLYHRHLLAAYPSLWKPLPTGKDGKEIPEPISPLYLMQRLLEISQTKKICYLHPSFGYYFEVFQPYPSGLALEMRKQPRTDFSPTRLSESDLKNNLAFWQQMKPELDTIAALAEQKDTGALMLAATLSRGANQWGVFLQQNNRLPEAANAFQQAAKLNPENGIARVNFGFNQRLRGLPVPTNELHQAEQQIKAYRTYESILNALGPVDEPAYNYTLGQLLGQTGLYREAGQLFLRARSYLTNSVDVDLMVGRTYLQTGKTEDLFNLINTARLSASPEWTNITNRLELVRLEALAYFAKSNRAAGEQVLQQAIAQAPTSSLPLTIAADVYLAIHQPTNALVVIERQLQLHPDDLLTLHKKSVVLMLLNQYQQAIAPLTLVLEKMPDNYSARLNRATAYLQMKQWDEARKDYEKLRQAYPNEFRIYYGLGEIAYRKQDKRAARDYYQSYLKYAPAGTQERANIEQRLKELKGS